MRSHQVVRLLKDGADAAAQDEASGLSAMMLAADRGHAGEHTQVPSLLGAAGRCAMLESYGIAAPDDETYRLSAAKAGNGCLASSAAKSGNECLATSSQQDSAGQHHFMLYSTSLQGPRLHSGLLDSRNLDKQRVFASSAECVQALLEANAPWNAVDRKGRCAGDFAAERGHADAASKLLEAGARASDDCDWGMFGSGACNLSWWRCDLRWHASMSMSMLLVLEAGGTSRYSCINPCEPPSGSRVCVSTLNEVASGKRAGCRCVLENMQSAHWPAL